MVPEERGPALPATPGQPRRSVLRDGPRIRAVSELRQLTGDAIFSPGWVGSLAGGKIGGDDDRAAPVAYGNGVEEQLAAHAVEGDEAAVAVITSN